jgi:hypothetical protein
MPVTARLSKAFYDQLGEQVANELVDWFNQVDLTYRTELRELNDLNFARFDAKVGERLAELRSELEQWFRDELRAEIQGLRVELRAEMDGRFAKVDERFNRAEKRSEALADQIRDTKSSLVWWMFAFWIGTAAAVAGARLAL